MSDDLAALLPARRPTAEQPLIGQTVLIVDDSRFACEGLRQMCLRSGARLRRADSLAAARRHLGAYAPTIVIVDIGLPDGQGTDLIEEIAQTGSPAPVVLATSGDDTARDAALSAGATAFVDKPIGSLSAFQSYLLELLPADARPRGPRAVPTFDFVPDPRALADDLAHAILLLKPAQDPGVAVYAMQFLGGLARVAHDVELTRAIEAARKAGFERSVPALRTLVESRLSQMAEV